MRHHFIAPVLNRLRVRFNPVLPITKHGDGGVQLSPFPSLGAASAFTPGVVLCEFADTPASSISSSLPPRSQVFATFDGYEASHMFFPAVAVSCSIVYMKGYNFVCSSCVEVPVAIPSHALGFFFIRLLSVHVLIVVCRLPRVGRQFSVTTCCTSVTCVVRFGHLPVLLLFPLRRTRTFFILFAFLLSMWAYVFLVCVALIGVPLSFTCCHVCPVAESSTEVTIAQNRGPTNITFCCLGLLMS